MDNWETLIAARMRHRDERNEYSRNYYQAHKEYFAEYQKKYRARKAA